MLSRPTTEPDLLLRKLLLLYDCDTAKPPEDHNGKLTIRSIPVQQNKIFNKGIENLLPESLHQEKFYVTETKSEDGLGGNTVVKKLDKRMLCDWVCSNPSAEYFANFGPVLQIIEEFLGAPATKLESNDLE
ncbi:MAG TPA: hypothetical protein VGZ25_10780 [Gemmataceae bacterium]|jgi:hypothetical protein|nr:hypothetical protein [Gemmataceae bacterium]